MLLRDPVQRYVDENSDEAFAEIMDRYMGPVYWTCWRDLRNTQMAEDATQTVFLLFADKARSFKTGVCVSGWLFNTARFVCKNMARREARLRRTEDEAAKRMEEATIEASWQAVEPWLNDGLSSLSVSDREAILLRYFDGLSLSELAGALGIREEAARQRVSRAIGRLRRKLSGCSVAVSESFLAVLITSNANAAAPEGCRTAITQGLGQPTAAQAALIKEGTAMTMKVATGKIIAAGATVLVLGSVVVGGLDYYNAHRPVTFDSANAQSAESVLEDASKGLQSIQSLQAQITQTTINRTNQSRVGTIYLQRPNLCFSEETITYYPSRKKRLFEWRSDGTHQYNLFGSKRTLMPDIKSAAQFNANIQVDALPISDFFDPSQSPAEQVEQLQRHRQLIGLKELPDEPADGGTLKVVEFSSPFYAPGLNETFTQIDRYYVFYPNTGTVASKKSVITCPIAVRYIDHSTMGWTLDESIQVTQFNKPIPKSIFTAPM